jgi:metal-responsive CopG/Arc/MetJ family transcriptional regulator
MVAKRVLISIDEGTLARIDDAARRRGMTRSGFLAQAAMAQIEGDGAGVEATSAAGLPALEELPSDPPGR